ncbi:hypothetical protein L6Q96_17935 [Candidatus Binatia bacterium]|nr:hypothetical protein [Candidatus Binatia bacterium]
MADRSSLRNWHAAALGGALMVGGCLIGAGLIEAGFHVYHWVRPTNERGFFWEPHPPFGWRHPPGRSGTWYDDHGEFKTSVRINSKGLRDVEHAYAKPKGVFRILILGDSYMEALQVELEETFGRILDQELNQRCHTRIEVINSGVASFGTDNELLYFQNEGYRYGADLVLLSFTTANDIRESYAPFNRKSPRANLTKPSFALRDDGTLEKRPGEPPPPPLPWWRRLYVGEYVYERLGGRAFVPAPPRGVPPPTDPNVPWVPWDMLVYAPEYSTEVDTAWRVNQALLRKLRQEVEAKGALFAVMLVNGPWAHYDVDWRRMMARNPIGLRTWDQRRPNRILTEFLEKEQIQSVDLFDVFEEAKDNGRLFFRFDPHWTPAGNRLAANTAADFLVHQGLVPVTAAATAPN